MVKEMPTKGDRSPKFLEEVAGTEAQAQGEPIARGLMSLSGIVEIPRP